MKKIRHVKGVACQPRHAARAAGRIVRRAHARPHGRRGPRDPRAGPDRVPAPARDRRGCRRCSGQCYGSSTWYSAMSDFVVMRKGAIMAVASPNVTSIAIGKPIDPEELGGWKLLTGVSGLADLAVDTDEQALDAVKRFLSYLPSHSMEPPPGAPGAGRLGRGVPEDPRDPARSRATRCTTCARSSPAIADKGSSFELKERFGRSVATVLARLERQERRLHRQQSAVQGRRARRRRLPEGDELHGAVRFLQHPDRVPGGRARAF